MPRIRSIKPEAPQHRKVGRLSDRAFRLWVVMITQADDAGRLSADPAYLRNLAWGYHPDVTVEDAAKALQEIADHGLVKLYMRRRGAISDVFAYFSSWLDHQKIDRPSPSTLPSPYTHKGKDESHSSRPRRALDVRSTSIRRGSEGSTTETKAVTTRARVTRIVPGAAPPATEPQAVAHATGSNNGTPSQRLAEYDAYLAKEGLSR